MNSKKRSALVGLPSKKARLLHFDVANKDKISYINESEISDYQSRFLLIIERDSGIAEDLLEKLYRILSENMNVDRLIRLLKRLGVEEGVAEAVRTEIENDHAYGIAPIGPDVDLGGALSEVEVETGIERLTTGHAARVLEERNLAAHDLPHRPANWEDAIAKVPGLRKWTEVKREGLTAGVPLRDILIDHLRDHEHGLGFWAASGTAFPVSALRQFDQTLRHDIGDPTQWDFPDDICLIAGSKGRPIGSRDAEPRERQSGKPYGPHGPNGPYGSRVPTPSPEEVREARRILKRAERAAQR